MPDPLLPFDPIERAGDLWEEHFGEAGTMRLATSLMRAQQLLLGKLDAALKPHGLTFARYEVLVLLLFSRDHTLPMSKVGERLMVHPTSVTSAIDRLESQGLVERLLDDADRRRRFARLTREGKKVVTAATKAVTGIDFAITGLSDAEQAQLYDVLRTFRQASGDFPA